MSECHRLGIKNFRTIRHSGQIKLVFDLCADDTSAPRHVSSKGDNYNKSMQISNDIKLKFDYFPLKQSNKDWAQQRQYFKIFINFVINIFHLILRVICLTFKYFSYLLWCLFKIFLCTIFRVLTKSKICRPKGFVCHPIRCNHHRFYD